MNRCLTSAGINSEQAPENHFEVPRRESSVLNFQASLFYEFGPNDCNGMHVSSCGHAVYHECLDCYLSSLWKRYNSKLIFEGMHIVDTDQGKFLCHVFHYLANSILTVLPHEPAADICIATMPFQESTTCCLIIHCHD